MMRPLALALVLGSLVAPWSGTAQVTEPLDLSIVLCGRNDAHAGNFMRRFQVSVLSLALGLCRRRHRVSAEIVIVEWLPPKDAKVLSHVVKEWLQEIHVRDGFFCAAGDMPLLRFITVSERDVQSILSGFRLKQYLPGKDGMDMLQWHCKNVGVVRAQGQFVLVTNGDDFFSPELFDVVASARHLRRDSFYRAQTVTLNLRQDPPFGAQVHDAIFSPRFYTMAEEHMQHWALYDGVLASGTAGQLCRNSSAVMSDPKGSFSALWADYDAAFGVRLNDSSLDFGGLWQPMNLYMDNPGDFLLASREAWEKVRGAPLVLQNHNVDMLLICRFAAHFRQVVLASPCAVATLDHPSPIHSQFQALDRRIRDSVEELAIFRTRLQGAHARLRRARRSSHDPRLTLLADEIRRRHLDVFRKAREVHRLRRKRELRIDNVFDRCREPFKPFASEARLPGYDPEDWGFRWLSLPETLLALPRSRSR